MKSNRFKSYKLLFRRNEIEDGERERVDEPIGEKTKEEKKPKRKNELFKFLDMKKLFVFLN